MIDDDTMFVYRVLIGVAFVLGLGVGLALGLVA
jgi:hypothetical protein